MKIFTDPGTRDVREINNAFSRVLQQLDLPYVLGQTDQCKRRPRSDAGKRKVIHV